MKSIKGLVRQALRLKKNEVRVEVGTNMSIHHFPTAAKIQRQF